jgi:energy-coupling factor transport system permease protein
MNQFEYLPLVTIGQYLPTGSLLHRLDARTKLVIFSAFILAVTFTPSVPGMLAALAAVLAGILLAKIKIKTALKGLLAPLPFLLFIILLQLLFFASPTDSRLYFSWWIIRIGPYNLISAAMLMLRFVVLILAISLSSFCLSTSEMITGLDHLLAPLKRIGIQTMDLVMVIQVTVRFLPLLALSAERIAKAQASRGAEWSTHERGLIKGAKRVIPLLVPLLMTSLRRSESLALAMDARAYGMKNQRTSIYELRFHRRDAVMLLAGIAIILAVVLL